MNIKNLIRIIARVAARGIPFARSRRPQTHSTAEQLILNLDQATESGLRLREALPVRSAEYWLQLGQPDLALKELETLPENTRQHPWPLRVQLVARHALNTLAT